MKKYKMNYSINIEVYAKSQAEAMNVGADLLSLCNIPMEWYFQEIVDEEEAIE